RLSTRGDGGHTSAPPTVTAVRRIARALDRLGPGTFPARTPRTISRMLGQFAALSSGAPRLLYRVLAAVPPLNARVFALMGGEPAAFVRTTVAATMQSGGTAANVLPSQADATVNLRLAVGDTVEGAVQRLRRRIRDPKVEVTVIEGDDPTPESAIDNAQFALIRAAVSASHPTATTVPYLMMQASDSRHFHRFSPAVYRFAPLAMSAAQRASIHGVDERVEIAELERGERFHRALIERLQ
ncbi:MAG: M20/M25/M40 family metallo-hydrolase, partial [Microbacterium sp.]|nr:M20/M25/M40 family metallo-hydrolase [Microbacterium sp.]